MSHALKGAPIASSSSLYLYMTAALFSLLLSFAINATEAVINPDAICYLLGAEVYAGSGIKSVMSFCTQARWPFYSILIYYVAQFTTCSYLCAAYVIDALFSLLSVLAFLKIVQSFTASRLTLWCALGVILLAHEFNSVRQYIVRDHGFWAFYLISVYLLLRFFKVPRVTTALWWGVSLICAALFRIEGLLFLWLLPWISWSNFRYSWYTRAKQFLALNSITLAVSVLFLGWYLLSPHTASTHLGRVSELFSQLEHGLMLMQDKYQHVQTLFANEVLPPEAARDAGLVWLIMVAVWYVYLIVANVSLIYMILFGYAWCVRAFPISRMDKWVLFGYLGVGIFITLGFFLEYFYLSKRYLMVISLILMLWVPFALTHLIQHARVRRYKVMLVMALLLIILSGIGGIFHFGYSKKYLREAGEWLHTNIPEQATLYANDLQLMYYSGHYGLSIYGKAALYLREDALTSAQLRNFDYIALRQGGVYGASAETLVTLAQQGTFVASFSNKRGDRVLIYKIK